MFRSLFLAIGATALLLGVEALALDRATVRIPDRKSPDRYVMKTVEPTEWVPWSLMGAGTVVIIYSFMIPRRMHG